MKNLIKKYKQASSNDRNIINNVTSAVVIKGASLLLSLLTLPAYLRYFDNQLALGLWFSVISVLAWVLNFDLGIGNGLRNLLTHALTEGDKEKCKKLISSGYISLGIVVIAVTILFVLTYQLFDWNFIFNIDTNIIRASVLELSILIVFLGIMIQFFLRLISSVLYAMQQSSINNFLSLCTALIIFMFVSLAPSGTTEHNLILMAIVYCLAVTIPLLGANIIVFAFQLKEARPSLKYFDSKSAKQVLSLGGIFFFVQIMYMVIMNSNEYLITIFAGNEHVVTYQVYYKLFTAVGILFTLGLTPIWSAVTKAIAEKNHVWVQKLYNKLIILCGVTCLLEFLLVPFIQPIINIWLGENSFTIQYSHALLFAVLGCLMLLNGVFSSIANGAGELKTQAVFFGIGAFAKIPIAWILVLYFDSWIGVVIANIVALGIYCIVQPFWLKKYFREMEEKGNINVQE